MNSDDILENVHLAAGCGADPAMILAVALATARPSSLDEAFDFLEHQREAIGAVVGATERPHARLAVLEPRLQFEPELARMRLDEHDHELRGRRIFADLLGKRSFVQVAALAIAGLDLSDSDAELLDREGALTHLGDPRIWPLAVTRRIACGGGTLAHATIGGLASLCTDQMTVLPVGGFMRFLDRVDAELAKGVALDRIVATALAERQPIPGVGRPVLGADERVPPKLAIEARYGRGAGPGIRLAHDIDAVLEREKGLRVNSAGFHGALMRDIGFSPDAASAFCVLYFIVPVLAHAVYPAERRRAQERTPAAATAEPLIL